jgi:SAM-dependent methyltransferase
MADLLYKVRTRGVRNYLEIGCGFGFVLDFARHAFGWRVAGVDPGIIARTGQKELDLDIAPDYVTPGYDFGGRRFDLILCSEVVEHVPAPGPFLETLERGLTHEGVLLLTTPNADRVRPDTPPSLLLPILQPGFHLVLFTRDSLQHALRKAGFSHIEVWEEGATLTAVSSMRAVAVNRDARVDARNYRSYLERGVKRHPASPLAVGMAYRLLKHATNTGDLGAAEGAFACARSVIMEAYRIDIGRPEALGIDALPPLQFLEVGAHMPFCLGCVLYHRAVALLIGAHYADAARFFRAASAATLAIRRALHTMAFDDGDSEAAAQLSRMHLPMALAHVDPGLALGALAELSEPPPSGVPDQLWVLPRDLVARARQETFTRLVSVGSYAAAETIIDAIRDDVGFATQAFNDAKMFGAQPGYTLSALYSLGMLTRNHLGDRGAAAALFAAVRAACQARLVDVPRDVHAADLGRRAFTNETECRAASRSRTSR